MHSDLMSIVPILYPDNKYIHSFSDYMIFHFPFWVWDFTIIVMWNADIQLYIYNNNGGMYVLLTSNYYDTYI